MNDFGGFVQTGRPALPNSYFWTWDHSTNWILDDPGNQTSGCYNAYLKRPETYVEDYRRLSEAAGALGVRGIVIWGFLRDSHGGVEYAKRVAAHAAERGVSVWPGFGTTWYGGAYYEGDHPFSLRRFLTEHPDARMLDEHGQPRQFAGDYGACPAHPAYQQWLRDALDWMFKEFPIGGLNVENGDMLVDYHPLTQALRKDWPADDPEPFFFQGLSYRQVMEALGDRLKDQVTAYATYSGFNPSDRLVQNVSMGHRLPAMLDILPREAVCQWTLTGMLLDPPLPLTAYLDDGAPEEAFKNPNWPKGLAPPPGRHVGFVHQGSQWWGGTRHRCVVSTIKEACLRAHRAGLEGVGIHGEVSPRHIPYALNYLAFSHFIHKPADTLRQFGRDTLGAVLGSQEEGERFVEILCRWDAGAVTDDDRALLSERRGVGYAFRRTLEDWQRSKYWVWLHQMVHGAVEGHTVSFQV